jgi:hypothetical protein
MVAYIKSRDLSRLILSNSTSTKLMKFNSKQLLTLTVFFGSIYCTSAIGKDGLIGKIEGNKDKMVKFEENQTCKKMIIALNNPNCFVKSAYKFTFPDDCVDEHAHDFYRIIFTGDKADEQLEAFSNHCKAHEKLDDLDEAIVKTVTDAYEVKKKFLTEIVYQIPIIAEYRTATDDFDATVKSHIDKFIDDALVYDGKRLTFSNLHKAVESIKNAHEVERKASDGVEAVLEMLKNKDTAWKKFTSTGDFRIKKANIVEKKDTSKKDSGKEEVKPKNIVEVGIKASDKSTSSPTVLGFILIGSLLISMILLVFKAYTAEEVKEEEEEQH